jgi:pyruvate formate lyase activating enzyme
LMNDVPLIFDIRRGGLEDGPGIRTTVFFKGCPLHCVWCHNPESIDPDFEIGFYENDCIGCGDCVKACPLSACRLDNPLRIDRLACNRCAVCTEACPSGALRLIGRVYAPEELVGILMRDRSFYEVSHGGVTLSGGEPTLFPDYCREVLGALKKEGVHTALETNGFFDLAQFKRKVLPYVDLILFDLKVAGGKDHLRWTGVDNSPIIENLKALVRHNSVKVEPRIPLIPHFTATGKNVRAFQALLTDLGAGPPTLLPYNPAWFHKARSIGRSLDERLSTRLPTAKEMDKWREMISDA